jgi:hypothetical protein
MTNFLKITFSFIRIFSGGEKPYVLRREIAHFHANAGTARAAPLEIVRLERLS